MNTSVKRTTKEQGVEWKLLVYSTFCVVLFLPKVVSYTNYPGDGDSKTYQRVLAEKL